MNKILLIEDDANIRENLSELLTAEGYLVIEAADGKTGITKIKEEIPDIVICDVEIPEVSGFDVLKELRENKISDDKPFIFLTGKASREDMRHGMELGADDYITKPFTLEEVLKSIQGRLKRKSVYDEKLEKLKDSIKYALPHEMLSPLNSIILSSQMIVEETKANKDIEMYSLSKIVNDCSTQLKDVINKYLYLINIAMLKAESDNKIFSLYVTENSDDIISQVSRDLAQKYNREKDLKISLEKCNVAILEEHLYRIIYELVDNAFKFSKSGKKVSITSKVEGDQLCLLVHNTGSHMTAEEISHISEFLQFDRIHKEIAGMGLGLSIVVHICSIYNCKYYISSSKNDVNINVFLKKA